MTYFSISEYDTNNMMYDFIEYTGNIQFKRIIKKLEKDGLSNYYITEWERIDEDDETGDYDEIINQMNLDEFIEYL